MSLGSEVTSFAARVRGARDGPAFAQTVADCPRSLARSPFLAQELRPALADEGTWTERRTRLLRALRAYEVQERFAGTHLVSDPKSSATMILQNNPAYRDTGATRDTSWMARSFDRAGKAIDRWFEGAAVPGIGGGVGAPGLAVAALEPIVWILLGGGLLVFLVIVLTRFSWGKGAVGRRKAVLADEEPDLSADEWLVESGRLESEGRHREAVRCLYLASLMRLDEAGTLRFVRSETNWEHLRRYESGPRDEARVDLRPLTRQFDRVWYGYRPCGPADVDETRRLYKDVLRWLRVRA